MKKKLKSIEVGLIGCGDAVTLTAQDTATEPMATYALDAFSVENQMHFKDGDAEYYAPFHAVDHIIVEESEAEVVDRPNPYGCEPSGADTKGEVWYTGTIDPNAECVAEEAVTYRGVELSPTEIANAGALWDSPNGYDISVNDTSLSLIVDYDYMKAWAVGESSLSYEMPLFSVIRGEETEQLVATGVPCDWTGDVEITVVHK